MVSYEYKECLLAKLKYDEFILEKIIDKYSAISSSDAQYLANEAVGELGLVVAKILEIEKDLNPDALKDVFNV